MTADNDSEIKAQLARANDMIRLLENQRNNAHNESVQLGAQLLAAQRRIKDLEAGAVDMAIDNRPQTNGHDREAHAGAAA